MVAIAQAKPIPAVPGLPLLGSLLPFQNERLAFLRRVAATYGDIARFQVGPVAVVLVNAPDLIHEVLIEQADAFDKGFIIHRAFKPVVGNGLINNEGASWRIQRKLLAPAFQPRQIGRYGETMVAYTAQAAGGWADGSEIAIDRAMTSLTMRIVGKTLFDDDVLSGADDLGAAITQALEYMEYLLNHFVPTPLFVPTPRSLRTRQALALIDQRIKAMIATRRAAGTERGDLLSLLLQARYDDGSAMSDQQVRDEAMTIFLAGHETTALTLAWAFYLLATHPAVYDRLLAEVDGALGGRPATVADLPALPYCLQVFKEAIRLYPPAYTLGRTALRAVDVGGYAVRKNDIMMLSPFTMHRRPDFFPDPDAFAPERFTPEAEKRLPRHAYLPFGAGPRVCIGNHFALMEGQLLLATLAQQVRFSLVPGQQIVEQPVFTLRQKYGCRVIVHRRDA